MSSRFSGVKANWRIDAAAIGVCLLLTAGLYLSMVHPLAREKALHQTQEVELASHQVTAAERGANLGKLQAELADTRKALDATPLRLQPAAIINQRLSDLTDLANRQNVTLDQVQPGQAASAPRYDVVPIRLVGAGAYEAVVAFLGQLHEQFGDTGVRSFKLTAGAAGQPGDASFTIDLIWYTAPSPRTP